jgi:hypothetical protein
MLRLLGTASTTHELAAAAVSLLASVAATSSLPIKAYAMMGQPARTQATPFQVTSYRHCCASPTSTKTLACDLVLQPAVGSVSSSAKLNVELCHAKTQHRLSSTGDSNHHQAL